MINWQRFRRSSQPLKPAHLSHFLHGAPPGQPAKNASGLSARGPARIMPKRFLTLYSKQNCKMNGYRYDCPTLVAAGTKAQYSAGHSKKCASLLNAGAAN